MQREIAMVSMSSKSSTAAHETRGPGHLFGKLGKLLPLPRRGGGADDPVCLSALDDTTLGRFGYNEMQIHLMKESTFR
jgi:hypothetical protein